MSKKDEGMTDIIALLDQLDTGLSNQAKVLSNFRKELIEGGFSEDAAEQMVVDFNRAMFNGFGRGK